MFFMRKKNKKTIVITGCNSCINNTEIVCEHKTTSTDAGKLGNESAADVMCNTDSSIRDNAAEQTAQRDNERRPSKVTDRNQRVITTGEITIQVDLGNILPEPDQTPAQHNTTRLSSKHLRYDEDRHSSLPEWLL